MNEIIDLQAYRDELAMQEYMAVFTTEQFEAWYHEPPEETHENHPNG